MPRDGECLNTSRAGTSVSVCRQALRPSCVRTCQLNMLGVYRRAARLKAMSSVARVYKAAHLHHLLTSSSSPKASQPHVLASPPRTSHPDINRPGKASGYVFIYFPVSLRLRLALQPDSVLLFQ
jgi:hypothetical protein